MPNKKKEEEKQNMLWGRPGNTLKMGIVGLPNVGKSTTFNILSKLNVPTENFPFCTKDPNVARIPIPDQRFNKLCQIFKPKSQVSAVNLIYKFISITDIAGLVRGASQGEGLGNAFLSHIRQVDGIYEVVRVFDSQEIVHYELEVDPIRDLEIISQQLIFKDQQYCSKRIQECEKKIKRSNQLQAKEEKNILEKVMAILESKKWTRNGDWSHKQIITLNKHNLLTAKPVVYLVNLSQQDFLNKKNKWLGSIKKWIENNNPGLIIPFSAQYQKNILEPKEQTKQSIQKPSTINKIIKSGYHCLDLIHFFTAGEDQVKCWTVRKGSKAPQAAGIIHTDFEKGFICAEVMKYTDFIELGSQSACKHQGKYRQQGKEYVVQDGDMIFFKFNVASNKKK